jgi:four helix bundle protein
MANKNLNQRTKQFALRIIRMVDNFPVTRSSKIIGDQILRSATSLAANYRASCLAKSKRDFINKLKTVEEETDETIFWLELIEESKIFATAKILPVKTEAHEILKIIIASIKTTRKNQIDYQSKTKTNKEQQIGPSN